MRLNVCVNEMTPFGPFAAFIKAVSPFTVLAEIELSAQEERADPRGMKMFAVEIYELPKDFVHFRTLCEVQSSPLVFAPNRAFVCGPLLPTVVGTGSDSVFQGCALLS